jgi:TonB-linked SusC/RagA family outer membrane protein
MGGPLTVRNAAKALTALAAVVLCSSAAAAQTAVFTGRVTSTGGQPLGGANVAIPDLGVGGVADATGRYTFTVDVGNRAGRQVNVTARYIGYRPQRLPVTLTAGRIEQNFSLERDVLSLEEVVVTGTSEATSQRKTPFAVGVVDNTQIKEVPALNPISALQGKVPGAAVITTSGQPGAEPSIRLRAPTSLTGRQDPLFIVDGTITHLGLADINSEDIERVEIIKGAAASSLYGSNAANGVIQIFTKRGARLAEAQTSVTARNEWGVSYLPRLVERNMSHNFRLADPNNPAAGFDLSGGSRTEEADLIIDNPYPVYHDQLEKVFRSGQKLTNYVSVGQRRGNTNFNASFQNEHDQGVLRLLQGYKRQNVRLNVDHALSEKADIGVGTFYGRSSAHLADDWFGIFFGMVFLEPNINIDSIVTACPAGVICSYVGQYNPVVRQPPRSGNVVNPLYDLQTTKRTNNRDRFSGTLRTQYRLLDWLTADGNVGYDRAGRVYKEFTPVGYTSSTATVGRGQLYTINNDDRSYNVSVSLTSSRQFGDFLRNTTKLAGSYEDFTINFTDVLSTQLTVPKVPEFGAADPGGTIRPDSRTEITRARNVFAISTFDIKDRYILDGLLRRDESSLFGADERTAIYHRLSGAWRVTEDVQLPGIEELKLRVSHGTAGLRPRYEAQYETFDVVAGSPVKVTLGNTKLKPAFSRETEYGLNVNFLRNYSLDYTFSKKRTTDQIILVPLSGATGYQQQWQNAGTLSGHSHELALGAVLLSRADYFWRVTLTGDRTRQKIDHLTVPPFFVGPDPNDANTRIFRIASGQPFGVIYGAKWIRTAEQLQESMEAMPSLYPGPITDYRLNEDGYYVRAADFHTIDEAPLKAFICEQSDTNGTCTSAGSVVQIGDVNPDFNLGLNSTAQWKGLTFNTTLVWVKGGDIYNYTRQWPFNELRDNVYDQSNKPATSCPANWETAAPTCPYDTGKKPATYYQAFYNNFDPNEYFVEDGSYFRLRELAVNWALPQRWVRGLPLGFTSARLGVVGRNLWTSTKYSGYDPDVSGPGGGNPFAYRVDYFTYPAYRTFTAMLELGY